MFDRQREGIFEMPRKMQRMYRHIHINVHLCNWKLCVCWRSKIDLIQRGRPDQAHIHKPTQLERIEIRALCQSLRLLIWWWITWKTWRVLAEHLHFFPLHGQIIRTRLHILARQFEVCHQGNQWAAPAGIQTWQQPRRLRKSIALAKSYSPAGIYLISEKYTCE